MTVSFGILGAGAISTRFSGVLGGMGGVRAAAVADTALERAQALAERDGIPRVYRDMAGMLEDPGVDAVYIGLPNHLHYEAAARALEAGKAVLCEKPMCLNLREASALAARARERGILLMEAMWTRCLPAYAKIGQWLRQGRIGRVGLVRSSFCFRAQYQPDSRLYHRGMGGGCLYDVGVYSLHFAIGLLGEPVKIQGAAVKAPTGVDATACVTLTFPSGALAVSTSSISVDAPGDAGIYGSAGSIAVADFWRARRCVLFDAAGRETDRFEDEVEDGFAHEIAHFASLLREGRTESPLVPLTDTLRTAAAYDALREEWGF